MLVKAVKSGGWVSLCVCVRNSSKWIIISLQDEHSGEQWQVLELICCLRIILSCVELSTTFSVVKVSSWHSLKCDSSCLGTAGQVDDLCTHFLEHAQHNNPLVGPALELTLSSDLSRPTDW